MIIKIGMIIILFISGFDILIGVLINDWVISILGLVGFFQYILFGLELEFQQ